MSDHELVLWTLVYTACIFRGSTAQTAGEPGHLAVYQLRSELNENMSKPADDQ